MLMIQYAYEDVNRIFMHNQQFFISGDNAIGIIVDAIYLKFIMKPEVQEETLSNPKRCQ